jgi:hypothetical protein
VDARPLRPADAAGAVAALPHPDGRRVAHGAAALQQRRPHRAPGARRGARRHQLAAHQLARRGAGAAHEGIGHDRAPSSRGYSVASYAVLCRSGLSPEARARGWR